MRAMLFAAMLLLFLASVGCSSTRLMEIVLAPPEAFKLSVKDVPEQRHFELVLTSLDPNALCLDVEQWPNSKGGVHFGSDVAVIEHSAGSVPIRDSNFGYCPNGCGVIRIESSSSIRAIIPYEEFGDPDAVYRLKNRTLRYSIAPRYCAGE
jgi:hypothetical protein